mmetsp:Transcript_103268/g.296433  ORF Transcript_103268/g.296433 Transcript_103268/m.296433 type:complete len:256 (+) Transcript_103268:1200-1967(+)
MKGIATFGRKSFECLCQCFEMPDHKPSKSLHRVSGASGNFEWSFEVNISFSLRRPFLDLAGELFQRCTDEFIARQRAGAFGIKCMKHPAEVKRPTGIFLGDCAALDRRYQITERNTPREIQIQSFEGCHLVPQVFAQMLSEALHIIAALVNLILVKRLIDLLHHKLGGLWSFGIALATVCPCHDFADRCKCHSTWLASLHLLSGCLIDNNDCRHRSTASPCWHWHRLGIVWAAWHLGVWHFHILLCLRSCRGNRN